jgi:hypothetical protein
MIRKRKIGMTYYLLVIKEDYVTIAFTLTRFSVACRMHSIPLLIHVPSHR